MLLKTSLIFIDTLGITARRLPDADLRHPGTVPAAVGFRGDQAGHQIREKLGGGIAVCRDDLLELRETLDHRVGGIEDHLVIKALNYLFDTIIINKDPGGIVDLALHPYLHPPLVAVKPEALPLVMEEAMTCLKIGFLVYTADHCLEFLGEEDIILLAERFQ
jgi:hypothetical protein